MKWIELTEDYNGRKVFVNTEHITDIWDLEEYRCLNFDTGTDMSSTLKVKETYDEVKQLILDDGNRGCLQEALDNLHNLVKNNT